MTEHDIKYNLNHDVMYQGNVYKLVGATIRLNDKGYYYQAEILDKCKNSVLIVKLENIQEGTIQHEIKNTN